MYVDYNTLMHQKGFSELSENAKEFLKKECELLEIRFCNACGKFTSFGLYEDNCGDNTDWCSEECMETSGYTFKDMLVDFYETPMEGEEGYDEMMKAKAELSDTEFEAWLSERYEEDASAPVYYTEFQLDGLDPAYEEAVGWLEGLNLTENDLIDTPMPDTSPFRREMIMKTPDGKDVTVVVTDKELRALEEVWYFRLLRNLVIAEAENRALPYDHGIIEELSEEAIDSWNDEDESERAIRAVNTAFEIYRENNS